MTSAVTSQPLGQTDRIGALDAARGVALLGILIMNATAMALPDGAFFNLQAGGGTEGADFWSWAAIVVFFEGSMRALFSMLFGAGIILFMSRAERRGGDGPAPLDLHGRRMLWLVGFGLINTFVLLFPFDILLTYGLVGLALFPLRKLGARWLLAAAAALLALSMLGASGEVARTAQAKAAYEEATAAMSSGATLTEEQETAFDAWVDELNYWSPSRAAREEASALLRERDPITLWQTQAAEYASFFTSTWFWISLQDAAMAILLGMGLFKLGVIQGTARTSVYWLVLILGYGVGIGLGVWRAYDLIQSDFDYLTYTADLVFYDPRRIAIGLGHLALIHLLFASGAVRWLMSILQAIGQMAFTNYLVQSMLQVFVFYGIGLALYDQLQRHQIWYVILPIWAGQAIFSVLWLRVFAFGPLEWVWRSLTYVRPQPLMRRTAPS